MQCLKGAVIPAAINLQPLIDWIAANNRQNAVHFEHHYEAGGVYLQPCSAARNGAG